MKMLLALTFLTGCSTCDWVLDPTGPGRSYCYARKASEKLCKEHDGVSSYNPVSISCNDGTEYHGYEKEWR